MTINSINRKSLPIIKKPLIRSYTHHVNMCCISESYINADGMIADVDIVSSQDIEQWHVSTNNSTLKFHENNVKVYNDKYDENMQVYLFRECLENDGIIIKINHQQYTFAWATISIVVDNKPFVADCSRSFIFDYGNFSKRGLHVSLNEVIKSVNHEIKETYPIFLKLEKLKNNYMVSSSFDCLEWKDQGQYCLSETDNKLFIGVNISMYQNQWYNWFFTNYIQLKCKPKADNIHIDYYVNLSKNYKYYNLNMFLDYSPIDKNLIIDAYKELKDFIKFSINNNYYIELILDEYYISGYFSYQKRHRYHLNLIYGYDDELKVFKILGIDNGHLRFNEISYSDFDDASSNCKELDNIVLIKYNPDPCPYQLDLRRLTSMLKDYLNGYNNSSDCSYLVPETDEIFGIKLYDEFTSTENFQIFLDDIRISYLIKEHKIVMRERIKFLMHRGIIKNDDRLLSQANELVEISNVIMMSVIKNKEKSDINLISHINGMMITLKDKEILLFNCLITILEDYRPFTSFS